ncbi:chymotrypsin inhibitor-like isoform X2 [Bactrocera dorsalis]|uniref:Chymotrypsin inhibitor-like isoform X2 n=1 Tax=Bactrocera dorsalis TaxID=27457 RepID=A0ABM3JI99_BACDO|nr:chymotrypsin inhibitor-like isoform X2 [Bactrocera dorsalis]
MGNNIFIILMIFASFTAMAVVRPEDSGISCGPNAEFTTCGAYCEPTCYPSPYPISADCLQICRVGCQCNSGYLLNNVGECVLISEC